MKLELVATCLFGLEKLLGEEIDALGNTFAEAFRKREAWAIGGKKTEAGRNTEGHNVLGGEFIKGASK